MVRAVIIVCPPCNGEGSYKERNADLGAELRVKCRCCNGAKRISESLYKRYLANIERIKRISQQAQSRRNQK